MLGELDGIQLFNTVDDYIKNTPMEPCQNLYVVALREMEEDRDRYNKLSLALENISLQLKSKSAEIQKSYSQHFEGGDIDRLKQILDSEKEITTLTQIKLMLSQTEYADFMNEILDTVQGGLLKTSQPPSQSVVEESRLKMNSP